MSKLDEIRLAAESDLKVFARLVNPKRVYGSIHDELFDFWQYGENDNTLVLLPRDHQKSHCLAVKTAWEIVKAPWETQLYVSATADLAEKQLYAIKNMLTSRAVRRYWPDLINKEEGKREKWTTMEIAVDHPSRKEEGVRDPTVKAAGLTTNITGFHANRIKLDDIVVPLNAYTEEGRQKVASMYSQIGSIKTTGATTDAVGTRYHPKDIYNTLLTRTVEVYEKGELKEVTNLYSVLQRQVEEHGEFLWPKQQRDDGRSFGFDENELAKKRAEYIDTTQFYAQYYNDPNRGGEGGIDRSRFIYYAKNKLEQIGGDWYYGDRKLNIYASIDFAFSLKKRADFTSIVVIGMDHERNVYVLDIERFKTNQISEYFKRILDIYLKWGLRRMRAEVTVAQQVIVNELKNRIKDEGIHLKIDDYRPPTNQGSKEDRINGILQPRYDTQSIFHYKGGWCQTLEEELVMEFPPHDDVKDSLASAIDGAMPPRSGSKKSHREDNVIFSSRFGGVAYA
jgi:hypothetical protein